MGVEPVAAAVAAAAATWQLPWQHLAACLRLAAAVVEAAARLGCTPAQARRCCTARCCVAPNPNPKPTLILLTADNAACYLGSSDNTG